MDPGAIICAKCGFNLKTGEKVNIGQAKPVVTTKAQIGSAFGVIAPRKTPTIVEDKKAQLMKLLVPAALIAVVVLAIVGYQLIVKHNGAAAAAHPLQRDDAEVARLTDEYGAKEIHAWFKENPSDWRGI